MDAQTTSVKSFDTPILFLIFNRPSTTRQVFEAIRKMKPAKLYIAADGPRKNRAGEAQKCAEARAIATNIDWNCEVTTLFRDNNAGLGKGVSSAISWFFDHESAGIILEDDCLSSPSFFGFCAEMLNRYRDDTRIMQVGGTNLEDHATREIEYSYSFSYLTYIWGWATWRRAWNLYDIQMPHYEEINEKGYLSNYYDSIYERHYYEYIFDRMYYGKGKLSRHNVWSYQWQFTCHINSGLTIVPNRNLIANVGFGKNATNTSDIEFEMELEDMVFPLKHPEFVMPDKPRDRRNFINTWTSPSSRMKSNIKQVLPKPIVEKFIKPFWRKLQAKPIDN